MQGPRRISDWGYGTVKRGQEHIPKNFTIRRVGLPLQSEGGCREFDEDLRQMQFGCDVIKDGPEHQNLQNREQASQIPRNQRMLRC